MDFTNPISPVPEDEAATGDVVARLDRLAASDAADAPPLAEALADDLTGALDGVGDAASAVPDSTASQESEPADVAET
jgi:hypothetical protein